MEWNVCRCFALRLGLTWTKMHLVGNGGLTTGGCTGRQATRMGTKESGASINEGGKATLCFPKSVLAIRDAKPQGQWWWHLKQARCIDMHDWVGLRAAMLA